jgi:cytochrome c-type biogenesis protein CcmH
MISALFLFIPAALFGAAGVWWVSRAYAKAGGGAKAGLTGAAIGLGAALALYLALGRPDLPDEPFGERMAGLLQKNPTTMTAQELLAVLEARAKVDTADPRPLIFAGDIMADQGRPDLAADRYRAALQRDANATPALIGLGRALAATGQGEVPPEALVLFKRAAELAPDDAVPWLYQGLAANQEGRYAEALAIWPEVLKRLPADDPRRQMVAAMTAEAQAKSTQPR